MSITEQLDAARAALLKASVDLCVRDELIQALKDELATKDARITVLECQNRRSTLPFRRDQTVRL